MLFFVCVFIKNMFEDYKVMFMGRENEEVCSFVFILRER